MLSRIFTTAELTGAAVVLATFQVTVCDEPAAQVTAVLGAVTTNGPAVLLALNASTGLLLMPPTTPCEPLCASRTVTRKFRGRVVVGSVSPKLVVPAKRSLRRGK